MSDFIASGFSKLTSSKPEDVARWLQKVDSGSTRVRAIEAAAMLLATDSADPRVVKLSLRDAKSRKSTGRNKKVDQRLEENEPEIIETIRRQWGPELSAIFFGEADGNDVSESNGS